MLTVSKKRLTIVCIMLIFLLAIIPTALGATSQKSSSSLNSISNLNSIYISRFETVNYDTANELSGNKEFVEITNGGTAAVNMKEWKIIDEGQYGYVFPSYILEAKSTVTFFTGKGKNTANKLFGGKRWYIWNNSVDIIYLYDVQGKLVSTI
jgi:hypothetical protein